MIIVLAVYIALAVVAFLSRNYEKELVRSLDKKEHPLRIFYPMALYLSHFIDRKKSVGYRKRMEQIKILHANEDCIIQYQLFMAKKFAIIIFCIIIFNSLGACLLLTNQKKSNIKNGVIERPSYGQSSSQVDLDVTVDQDEKPIQKHVSLSILPREYTSEEFNKAVEDAKPYVEKVILGKNISLDKIYYPLDLITFVPNTALEIQWQFEDDDRIETNGTINHKGLTEKVSIKITAVFVSGNFKKEYPLSLTILPEVLSKEDQLLYELDQSLTSANEDHVTSNQLVLPDTIQSNKIYYEETSKDSMAGFIAFSLLVVVLVYIMMEQQLVKQKEERDIEIMLDYPELINKFTLLIGAGMTIKKAWEKIVIEYEERKDAHKTKRRYAYEELAVTLHELNNGVTESKAYETFGRRMQLMPYMKFSAMLAQNVSKGMEGILQALEMEAFSAFEERKELAKRLGEKAGTKLLLPMGIMLCLVMAMIIIPAMQMM